MQLNVCSMKYLTAGMTKRIWADISAHRRGKPVTAAVKHYAERTGRGTGRAKPNILSLYCEITSSVRCLFFGVSLEILLL